MGEGGAEWSEAGRGGEWWRIRMCCRLYSRIHQHKITNTPAAMMQSNDAVKRCNHILQLQG